MHLPGYNFMGPGTKLMKPRNPHLTLKKWSKPVNCVDKAAYHHDICYLKNKDTSSRNPVCEKNMFKELESIYNPSLRKRLDKFIVSKLIGTKMKFWMGVKKKSLAEEFHKRKFKKQRVLVNGIERIWAADLVHMQAFSKFNRGIKYLFAVIDVFSKYGWLIPLKIKQENLSLRRQRPSSKRGNRRKCGWTKVKCFTTRKSKTCRSNCIRPRTKKNLAW